MQRMKDLNIYDSSLIVLMSDHGAWVPVENFAASDVTKALTVAMATPVLAIKPPGAGGAFKVSSAPSAITDVPATIADIAGFPAAFSGQSVFAIDAQASRSRHHLVYGYGINRAAMGYLHPMREFVIDGSPYDAASWSLAGRHLPAD
jgi:arylsulfatase A-like enzyme